MITTWYHWKKKKKSENKINVNSPLSGVQSCRAEIFLFTHQFRKSHEAIKLHYTIRRKIRVKVQWQDIQTQPRKEKPLLLRIVETTQTCLHSISGSLGEFLNYSTWRTLQPTFLSNINLSVQKLFASGAIWTQLSKFSLRHIFKCLRHLWLLLCIPLSQHALACKLVWVFSKF